MPKKKIEGYDIGSVAEVSTDVMLLIFNLAEDYFYSIRTVVGIPNDFLSLFPNLGLRIALVELAPDLDPFFS